MTFRDKGNFCVLFTITILTVLYMCAENKCIIYQREKSLRQYWQSPGRTSHNDYTWHYNDVIMGAMASQITSLTIVYSTVYSGTDERKHESSASLAFVRGIHRGPVNSPHKWPVARKMCPFDDVIMPSVSNSIPHSSSEHVNSSWHDYYIVYFACMWLSIFIIEAPKILCISGIMNNLCNFVLLCFVK